MYLGALLASQYEIKNNNLENQVVAEREGARAIAMAMAIIIIIIIIIIMTIAKWHQHKVQSHQKATTQ